MPDESKESLSVRMRQSAALDTPHFIRAVVSGWADEVQACEEALRVAEAMAKDYEQELERHSTDRVNQRKRIAVLEEALRRMLADFDYLERTYPGLYTTGAGYVLKPRVLELRQALAQPAASQGASE